MIAFSPPAPLEMWRKCLGGRRRRARPRPLAAMGYLVDGPVGDELVEIKRLTLVLLYDEPIRRGQCGLRLAGFSGGPVPWGAHFGGPTQCRFHKDLMLQPVAAGQGYRMDLADTELLALGLRLCRDLDRHTRYCPQPRREQVLLPKLWAAFHPEDMAEITGDGQELAAYAARIGRPPQHLLRRLCHKHAGFLLFPLAWVSHHWQQIVTIYADLARFPPRQVFRLTRSSLAGFQDAAEFDFRSHVRGQASSPCCPSLVTV